MLKGKPGTVEEADKVATEVQHALQVWGNNPRGPVRSVLCGRSSQNQRY